MAVRIRNSLREKGRISLKRDSKLTPDPGRVSLKRDSKPVPNRNSKVVSRPARERRELRIPWHALRIFFSNVGLMCLLFFFIAGVSYSLVYVHSYITSSSYFTLKVLEIQGNSRLSSKEILEISRLASGANNLRISLSAVEETIAKNPWVKEISVKRVLPDKLMIGVTENEPVFWVPEDGVLYYADAKGSKIAPVKTGQFASLPTLEVEEGAGDNRQALPELVKSLQASQLPLGMTSVSWVRLSSARGVEVYMEDSRLKLIIGLEDWRQNLIRLGETLTDLGNRGELDQVREIKAQGSNVWVEKSPVPAVTS